MYELHKRDKLHHHWQRTCRNKAPKPIVAAYRRAYDVMDDDPSINLPAELVRAIHIDANGNEWQLLH